MEIKDDNGRCEGALDELTAEHIVSHFKYDKDEDSDYVEIRKETEGRMNE